jgi:hypothetical protein
MYDKFFYWFNDLYLEMKTSKYNVCHKFGNLSRNVTSLRVGVFYGKYFQFRQLINTPDSVAMAKVRKWTSRYF